MQIPKKKTPIPMIAGISILLLVPLGIGAAILATFQAEEKEKQEIEEAVIENSPFSDAKSKQSLETSPLPKPATGSIGAGRVENQSEGIPTGTYSNPPNGISSPSGTDVYTPSRPLEDFDSSTEQNQLSQRGRDSLSPDYSRPSSSNNFNSTAGNSLVEPLEDDSFITTPESSAQSTPPITEPLGSELGF